MIEDRNLTIATDLIRDGQSVRLIGQSAADVGVLCFHGGGGVAGDPAMMDQFGTLLSEKAQVCLAVAQYRTLTTDPDASLDNMLEDAAAALAWAKQRFPKGLWVLGASFGGLLALDCVLKQADGVTGLILLNPVTNTGPDGFANRVVKPEIHSEISPLRRYAGSEILNRMPCFIAHGEQDDVVPIGDSRKFAALWPAKRHRMVELSDAGHGFFNRSPRDLRTANVVSRFMLRQGDRRPNSTTPLPSPLGAAVADAKTATLPKGVTLLCCIGAQKAGTSWLFEQMTLSPQVHRGRVKERHYFDVVWLNQASAFVAPRIEKLQDAVNSLSVNITKANAKALHKVEWLSDMLAPYATEHGDHSAYITALTKECGDASVVCDFTPSYSGLSAENFAEISAMGDVRFVFIMRDPVARLWSQIRMACQTGEPNFEERCIEMANQKCKEMRKELVYRANYVQTLDALQTAGVKAEVVFYENLFAQDTVHRLSDFAGIERFDISVKEAVNEGKKVSLPEAVEQNMLEVLAPQYEEIAARFGAKVPDAWTTRFARYSGPKGRVLNLSRMKPNFRDTKIFQKVKQVKNKLAHQNTERQVAFLHIPKTAGQSITKELRRVCGDARHSPVRTHSQAAPDAQMPKGYRVYAGHIDWVDLETLDDDLFSFTVLRSPRERLASFYFFLKREAENQTAEALLQKERTGQRKILELSADEYFFGGPKRWQTFIHDHYDNFYSNYLITRRIRGWQEIQDLTQSERIERALDGSKAITGIYGIKELDRLEVDLGKALGAKINLQTTRVNTGPPPSRGSRWDDLMALLEQPENREKMKAFVETDEILVREFGLETVL